MGHYYYLTCFLLSLVVTLLFIIRWKNGEPRFTVMQILIPIANLAYLLISRSDTVEEAMIANIYSYVAGCYLYLVYLYVIIDLCRIPFKKLYCGVGFFINSALFVSMTTYKKQDWFYKDYWLLYDDKLGVSYLGKEYGPLHTVFYVLLVVYFILAFALLIHCLRKKMNVSLRSVEFLLLILAVNLISFFAGRMISRTIETLPLACLLTQIITIFILRKFEVYNVGASVASSIIESGDIGYFTFDGKLRYLGANARAAQNFPEIANIRIDSVIPTGEGCPIYDMVDEDGNIIDSRSIFDYVRILSTDWRTCEVESERSIILLVNGVNYRLARKPFLYNGKRHGTLFVMTDITEEQHKREVKAQEAMELRKLKEAADSASKAKSDFLASMSHEIRTPINAILGMDEMILRESDNPEIREYASNIQSAGTTLLHLINDILDFSKVESGKMELVCADYDTATLFEDLYVMITPRAEAKGLKLHFEVDERIPSKLNGDDFRIRQVITNLLTNSVKYTNTGDVFFTVLMRERTEEEIQEGTVTMHISVRDTGTGIRKEDMETLFEEFTRADKQNTRAIEGTGLGLPLTKRMLELMDSEIKVESTYGKGSDFFFELTQNVVDDTPIGSFHEKRQQQIKETATAKYTEAFTAPDAWILSVDDTPMNLKVIQALLKKTKVNIVSVPNGTAALEEMTKRHYDVVLLDHLMPGIDGVETFKQSRTLEGNLCMDTPIIALTANALTGAREMYLDIGFTDFLAKPVKGEALEAMLMKYIPKDKIQ